MMVASSLLFALMGVFVKMATAYYTTGEVVFYRSAIGLVLMLAVARMKRGTLRTQYLKAHVVRSLCGAMALCLWFYAIGKLPLALAMTLNYTAPIWITVIVLGNALLLRRQSIDALPAWAVLLGFMGVLMALRPAVTDDAWVGGLAGLASGVLSAVAFLQVASLGKAGEPGYRVVFYFSLAGMALGAVLVLMEGGPSAHSWRSIGSLLAVGLLAAGAQWSLTYGFTHGNTVVSAGLQYLTIAFSCVFGVLVFEDTLPWLSVVGVALIAAAGLLATNSRERPAGKG